MSITLQLKNYRKPPLQRAVVRIMLMVPLYAISSLIAIFSLEAAFFIDAVRDLYEAFVIYTFLQLLITYLGGERSLLIILHGRPPIPHPFPVNLFLRPMDVSDPWTLLNLKRGVLQYVQIKPLLVVATVILKATGTYKEGSFAADSGYTYVSVVYNISICLSLYCLAMFWVCVNKDLKPFRPVPKFLCVKGILFFSFWQSVGISILTSAGAIKKIGPYTDPEHMSLALVDSLICFEMPIFALAHQYAFQASDYIDTSLKHAARLPFIYAFRDAFGLKDVWEDTKHTIRGRGVSYQAYEPAEGGLHYGAGRQKRIRAGLRYAKGGQAKYWVPIPGNESAMHGDPGIISRVKRRVDERLAEREGYAPLLPKQADRIVHDDPSIPDPHLTRGSVGLFDSDSESDAPSITFESVEEAEDEMYERARRIGYAGFPNVDVSREEKRKKQWADEEGILAGRWTRGGDRAGSSTAEVNVPKGGKAKMGVYGGWADRVSQFSRLSQSPSESHVNVHGGPSRQRQQSGDGEWLYDGDNERLDAWHASNGHAGNHDSQMRWTKKTTVPPAAPAKKGSRSRRSTKSRHTQSPFSIGDTSSESDNGTAAPKAKATKSKGKDKSPRLPADAVDLVVEDDRAVEEARAWERRKGEPQSNAPAHIYRHERDEEGRKDPDPEIEQVYSPDLDDERRPSQTIQGLLDPIAKVESIEQRVLAPSRQPSTARYGQAHTPFDEDDNPWA